MGAVRLREAEPAPARRGTKVRYPVAGRGEPALSELEFHGCYLRPMTVAEYEAFDGRVEFYDSRTGVASMAAEAHFPHEDPLHMLGRLLERIAQMRGSPIVCRGAAEIRRRLPEGRTRHIHPDQMVYLDPRTADRTGSQYLTAGEDPYPDVVLEVDSTTDVRGNRLKLYEAWGFPEVWVEVPDAYAPGRRSGMKSELRIYLAEGGRYVRSEESGAFPGWRAADIHRALNERVISERTSDILSRVGRALGEREGTGPEDDPLLRQQRAEARAHGQAEGRAEGRADGRARMLRVLLRQRGLAVPRAFPAGLTERNREVFLAASEERILAAASVAASFADFLSLLEAAEL